MRFWWRQAKAVLKPDASPGCAPASPKTGVLYPLEPLTSLNSTEATERGAPLSVFNVLSVASVVQHLYIYAGQLEQTVYDPAGLAKFDCMREEGYLDLVYESEKVRIYWVRG